MAGFFNNLGRIFVEKGAWYKILTIVALSLTMVVAQSLFMSNFSVANFEDINAPAIILFLLLSILISGFSIQVIQNGMRGGENILPKLDFGGMFVCAVRFIPFIIVWTIYLFLLGMLCAFLAAALKVIAIILFALLYLLALFTGPILVALHAKNFSYKHVLNPITPFILIGKTFLPVLLLYLTVIGVSILFLGVFVAFSFILGISGGADAGHSLSIALIVFMGIFLYLNLTFQFAVNRSFADIVVDRLSDTEFLDEDFDIPSEDEEDGSSDGSDESLDY